MQATVGYNARLQLQSLAYAQGAQQLLNLSYGYGTGNNGQVQSITDGVDAGRTVNYTYDAWARLKTAQTTGSAGYPAWGLSWDYDRYGNRKAQNVTAGSGPSNQVTPNPSTNRLTDPGYSYDASGNMTADGVNTLTYDGENRVLTSASAGVTTTYTYDGNSLRVQKQVGTGTPTIYLFSGTKVIAEYAAGAAVGSPTREYIYSGSNLLAKIEGAATQYHHADHLSVRVTTDASGSVVSTSGHYPYGESWYGTAPAGKWLFTSYERDSESGNDYAMFRYHVNRLGRFSSPDPLAGSIADPQSLNRYVYVRNYPVVLTDQLGLLIPIDPLQLCPPYCGNHDSVTVTAQLWLLMFVGGAGGRIHAPLLDGSEGKEGGGGTGPTQPQRLRQALKDCVKDLFGVDLASFTPSRPGNNGQFTGYGPDAWFHGGNNAQFTVRNDASSFTVAQLSAQWSQAYNGPLPPGTYVSGLTWPNSPFTNYTANNLSPLGTVSTQVHELGHSLRNITTGNRQEGDFDFGMALQDCVKNKGGFRP